MTSKLEEFSSKRLVIVDTFDARMNHLRILAFSLLIVGVYGAFLWFLCSTRPGVMSGLLLFGFQIAMGFPGIRTYYDLGVANRANLHLLDPARLKGKGKIREIDIHLGDIPLIFEKMELQIRKHDAGSLDDLSDLAWFGIFVWAAISSTSFYFGLSGYTLCLAGAFVFLVVALMSYVSGYRTRREYGFEEDLSHLQYYVEKRLKRIDSLLPNSITRIYLNVLERRWSIYLLDFGIETKIGNDSYIAYHMGFPSDEVERMIVKAKNDIFTMMKDISNNHWNVEQIDTRIGSCVQLVNRNSSFSVSRRSSFVTSPSLVNDDANRTAEIISKVLSIVLHGR